jgi:hypothetical protein
VLQFPSCKPTEGAHWVAFSSGWLLELERRGDRAWHERRRVCTSLHLSQRWEGAVQEILMGGKALLLVCGRPLDGDGPPSLWRLLDHGQSPPVVLLEAGARGLWPSAPSLEADAATGVSVCCALEVREEDGRAVPRRWVLGYPTTAGGKPQWEDWEAVGRGVLLCRVDPSSRAVDCWCVQSIHDVSGAALPEGGSAWRAWRRSGAVEPGRIVLRMRPVAVEPGVPPSLKSASLLAALEAMRATRAQAVSQLAVVRDRLRKAEEVVPGCSAASSTRGVVGSVVTAGELSSSREVDWARMGWSGDVPLVGRLERPSDGKDQWPHGMLFALRAESASMDAVAVELTFGTDTRFSTPRDVPGEASPPSEHFVWVQGQTQDALWRLAAHLRRSSLGAWRAVSAEGLKFGDDALREALDASLGALGFHPEWVSVGRELDVPRGVLRLLAEHAEATDLLPDSHPFTAAARRVLPRISPAQLGRIVRGGARPSETELLSRALECLALE